MPDQPKGLFYRCPVHGDIAWPRPVLEDTAGPPRSGTMLLIEWFTKTLDAHAHCGQPVEPPCPVRYDGKRYFFTDQYGWALGGRCAVAIAFQHAVEEGLIRVIYQRPRTYRTYNSAEDHSTPAAAVRACWPVTFANLEVGDA